MSDEFIKNSEPYTANETQRATLKIAEKTGLGDLISDIADEFSLEDFDAQSEIPIPLEMIPYREVEVNLNDSVKETLGLLVESANDSEQPLEIPFALIGNSNELDRVHMLFNNFESLDSKTVSVNPDKLGSLYQQVLTNEELDTLVVSHTHPKVSDSVQESVLTYKISEDLKNKYGIKEVGLNLSLQDLYQLEALHEQIGSKVNVLLGVLMYDGNLVLVQRTEEGYRRIRHSNIYQQPPTLPTKLYFL